MQHLEDPPKSPLKRGTLNPQDFSPFLTLARGGSSSVASLKEIGIREWTGKEELS
jgi:hypothetical protein